MCIVTRIICNALFTHSVWHKLSSILVIINFLRVWIARSTAPLPVCNLDVLYSISIFFDFRKSLYSLATIAPALSVLIFSGSPYRLKFCFKKFNTSFVSDDLQIFTGGHLLNLSIAISTWCSPFSFLWFNFPVNQFEFLVPVPLVFLVFRSFFLVFDSLNFTRSHASHKVFGFIPDLSAHLRPPKYFGFR